MDKIKKFIDCYVPIYNCNMKCNYCYISTWDDEIKKDKSKKINMDPKFIRQALSKKRWGGPLMLNFCATGETLLCKELIDIIKELLEEGHYCMIVTNGTITPKFETLASLPNELRKRLFIKFSYHYLELKRLNLLDVFFKNVNKMKDSNISFTVEVTPSDEYIEYIDEIKKTCLENVGALPHVTVCRVENGDVPLMSKYSKEEFIKIWSELDSELFKFKIDIFGEKRNEFCYAGMWSYTLSLISGDLRQCYRGKKIQNIYDNIEEKIKEIPVGCNCVDPHCWNGHAFLAFGDIPELETPTFEQERNRKMQDGKYWITEEMSSFMKSKLFETNKELSIEDRMKYNKIGKKYKNMYDLKMKLKKILKRGK